ncbi:GLPGLI family protein [Flexibacter flexilis DSM 6793]|uniref:GLPGLI family protein n=1 Tax=Flexibacter flexilis DSM 6793 TaxID=927664 RepID=A0A1I1DSS0_9BACT|nr:GLPGLI family protein [Flexibacter flexilis]SFB75760.1 GLPGLI family protein [Flexibacter flexilis DSM 6793]
MAAFCLFHLLSFAQTNSGVATYQYVDAFGQPTVFKLYFNQEKSIYIANRGKKNTLNKVGEVVLTQSNFSEVTSVNKTIFDYFIDEEGDVIVQDRKNNKLTIREVQSHYPLIVREPTLPKINWQLTEQHKKIGKFNCQKATATFRGRNYEAWFTPEIPIPADPWKLHGLPGLILEAQDTEKKYTYTFVDITMPLAQNAADELNYTPKTGDEIKLTDYNKEVNNRIKEHWRALISKPAARGSNLTFTPSDIDPQELNFEQ